MRSVWAPAFSVPYSNILPHITLKCGIIKTTNRNIKLELFIEGVNVADSLEPILFLYCTWWFWASGAALTRVFNDGHKAQCHWSNRASNIANNLPRTWKKNDRSVMRSFVQSSYLYYSITQFRSRKENFVPTLKAYARNPTLMLKHAKRDCAYTVGNNVEPCLSNYVVYLIVLPSRQIIAGNACYIFGIY